MHPDLFGLQWAAGWPLYDPILRSRFLHVDEKQILQDAHVERTVNLFVEVDEVDKTDPKPHELRLNQTQAWRYGRGRPVRVGRSEDHPKVLLYPSLCGTEKKIMQALRQYYKFSSDSICCHNVGYHKNFLTQIFLLSILSSFLVQITFLNILKSSYLKMQQLELHKTRKKNQCAKENKLTQRKNWFIVLITLTDIFVLCIKKKHLILITPLADFLVLCKKIIIIYNFLYYKLLCTLLLTKMFLDFNYVCLDIFTGKQDKSIRK